MTNHSYITIEQWQKIAHRRSLTNELKTYVPKVIKTVMVLGGILIVLCIITPFTNWLIPIILKGIRRYG